MFNCTTVVVMLLCTLQQALEAMRSVMIVFNHSPSCFYAIRFILLEVKQAVACCSCIHIILYA